MHSEPKYQGNLPLSKRPSTAREAREARVAAALRENLLKRKQQQRARADIDGETGLAPECPASDLRQG
jgi:hypothetical protein